MIVVPSQIASKFDQLLLGSSAPKNILFYYRKWLLFYWDFCHKYQYNPFSKESLPLFLKKLEEKGQGEKQSAQAQHAITLFYQIDVASPDDGVPISPSVIQDSRQIIQKSSEQYHINEPTPYHYNNGKADQQSPPDLEPGASWVSVYDGLNAEIKIRHYSPKTLKAYRWWISNFQTFTKSKNYQLLSQQDVIDFLSFLAVEKKVSASSQNQAFNALLFLFRHVLKKDFGEIKGVSRAKRKIYIPVVLSREEIDIICNYSA